MPDLVELDHRIVGEDEMMWAGGSRQMERAFLRPEVSWKYRQDQKEIGGQEGSQDHPKGNTLQAAFVRAEDRDHQQRQEQESDIGLEIARANRVGVNGGEIAEIFYLPLHQIVARRLDAGLHRDWMFL